jgi:DNA-binding response OmpR family regulator
MSLDTILVVDDDPKIRLLLRRCFEGDGFVVIEADSAASTLEMLKAHEVRLITLDLRLGADNGIDVAKSIRLISGVPIIMVTGQDDVIDRVVGLEVGADDYITKPFHIREVLARIRSVLRRSVPVEPASEPALTELTATGSLIFDDMIAHLDRYELFDRNGQLVDLTSGDFRLLSIFLQNPNRILSRDRIMDLLSGTEWAPLDRVIDNQIARLRKKIERDLASPALIKTVRGIGYMLAADVSKGMDR